MKKLTRNTATLCAVLVSSCLLLGSCSKAPTEASSGYAILDNEYVDYTFEYPEDWNTVENSGMVMVKAKKDNVSISCTTFDVKTETVESYWYGDGTEENKGFFDYFKTTLGGTVEVISEEETSLGKEQAPALSVTYTATMGDSEYMLTQIVGIYNGDAYTLTYTAKPDTHDTYKGALTHALSTFNFG